MTVLLVAAVCVLWIYTIRTWHRGRCRYSVDLEEMPRHPERVQPIGDDTADDVFAEIAENLLDDGLAEVTERLGWSR